MFESVKDDKNLITTLCFSQGTISSWKKESEETTGSILTDHKKKNGTMPLTKPAISLTSKVKAKAQNLVSISYKK